MLGFHHPLHSSDRDKMRAPPKIQFSITEISSGIWTAFTRTPNTRKHGTPALLSFSKIVDMVLDIHPSDWNARTKSSRGDP